VETCATVVGLFGYTNVVRCPDHWKSMSFPSQVHVTTIVATLFGHATIIYCPSHRKSVNFPPYVGATTTTLLHYFITPPLFVVPIVKKV